MLNSGSIQLDTARFASGRQALDDRVADLSARRGEVGDAVDALLRAWRGDAADTFRAHWEDWRDGADDVIDDLRRNVAALALAATDLGRADADSTDSSATLQGRLG